MPPLQADPIHARVDDWIEAHLITHDEALLRPLRQMMEHNVPSISVSAAQGAFLSLLVRSTGARRILEIGCLFGYSTIWLARALGPEGRLIALDLFDRNTMMAAENCAFAGLGEAVRFITGPAERSLNVLINDGIEPFDFIFLDADKVSYPVYLDQILHLSRPGTLILADNIIREGRVTEPDPSDPVITALRAFMDQIARNDRLEATALQTVGNKGYDGFALIRVR